MPIVVTDAATDTKHVTVHNTDAGTSQTADKNPQAIADAIKAQTQGS